MLAPSGCRDGVFVGPDPVESVSCAMGAGTTVSSVIVTTAPPSCVVKTCREVMDCAVDEGDAVELDESFIVEDGVVLEDFESVVVIELEPVLGAKDAVSED